MFFLNNDEKKRNLLIHVDDLEKALGIIKDSEAEDLNIEDPCWTNALYVRCVFFKDTDLDFARTCHKLNKSNIRIYPPTVGY